MEKNKVTKLMRYVNIPIIIKIEKNLLENFEEILRETKLGNKKFLVIHGRGILEQIAKKISGSLKFFNHIEARNNSIKDVKRIEKEIQKEKPDFVIGVGGGRVLDPAKLASSNIGKSFISIPTTLSHDGIASPVAVIDYGDDVKSIYASMPYGVIVDINVIKKSPSENIGAGIGDLLSNISAAEDWLLAEKYGKFKVDYFALMLARIPALELLGTDCKNLKDEKLLSDAYDEVYGT